VELVATFLALLELVRLKQLRVVQQEAEGEIEILKQNSSPGVLDPSAEENSDVNTMRKSADVSAWDGEEAVETE
jgi:chromatin segregation and condensation protein Rec8/ScpA/Scc1 (kleisin family)